jgi:hypothetical protein
VEYIAFFTQHSSLIEHIIAFLGSLGFKTGQGIFSMRFGTIQKLHKKLRQWMKDQIAQDVPASDGCANTTAASNCVPKNERPASGESEGCRRIVA